MPNLHFQFFNYFVLADDVVSISYGMAFTLRGKVFKLVTHTRVFFRRVLVPIPGYVMG